MTTTGRLIISDITWRAGAEDLDSCLRIPESGHYVFRFPGNGTMILAAGPGWSRLHEYAITESILEIVQAEAARAGGGSVDEITLVVGELTTFVDSSIEFYFTEMSRGTAAEGARLRFQKLEAKAHCSGCGADFRPHNAFFTCPQCRSAVFELRQGQELFIESIEVSEPEGQDTRGD